MKALLLIALLPFAAKAQLTMYTVNGAVETAVGATYSFGQIAINTTSDVHFRVYNIGSTAVSANVTISGMGFSFDAPPLPTTIPPHSTAAQSLNVIAHFTASSAAGFSASLQAGSLSVILLGSGISAPTLTSVSGCSSSAPYNFGAVQIGGSSTCTFALQNLNSQPVTISSVGVNGSGFSGPFGLTAPLTLQAGQSASFSVNFTPSNAIPYSAMLTVGTQSFALSGLGQPPPLPKPTLQFDSGVAGSAQQRVLTMTIPGGSPTAANGTVNLTFTPSTAAVKDDSAIVFLANGARTIPFSVSTGATQVLLNGQSSAVFQTGTTEGTLTFSVTTAAAMTGDPTTKLTIPGAPLIVESASASKERLGFLDISVSGADNTYSAGAMSFSFLDTNGKAIGSTVSTDFTSAFKTYYAGQTAGSGFKLALSFPVTGSATQIGSVTMTMTNAAGIANAGTLTFQ